MCLIVPITSKIKEISGYTKIEWKRKIETICLDQVRVISPKRVLSRIGKVNKEKVKNIKEEIKKIFSF